MVAHRRRTDEWCQYCHNGKRGWQRVQDKEACTSRAQEPDSNFARNVTKGGDCWRRWWKRGLSICQSMREQVAHTRPGDYDAGGTFMVVHWRPVVRLAVSLSVGIHDSSVRNEGCLRGMLEDDSEGAGGGMSPCRILSRATSSLACAHQRILGAELRGQMQIGNGRLRGCLWGRGLIRDFCACTTLASKLARTVGGRRAEPEPSVGLVNFGCAWGVGGGSVGLGGLGCTQRAIVA